MATQGLVPPAFGAYQNGGHHSETCKAGTTPPRLSLVGRVVPAARSRAPLSARCRARSRRYAQVAGPCAHWRTLRGCSHSRTCRRCQCRCVLSRAAWLVGPRERARSGCSPSTMEAGEHTFHKAAPVRTYRSSDSDGGVPRRRARSRHTRSHSSDSQSYAPGGCGEGGATPLNGDATPHTAQRQSQRLLSSIRS